jgi:autotransporter-associated beta strand protein
LNFNGGGVRWASGNASDISTRKIAIQSGGATLDSGSNDISLAFPIGGNGSGGLTKIGAGKIVLNGNNAYSGITRVAGGVLGLGTSGALPNSSSILISNGATLDVSERLDGTLTLRNKKTLPGCGHVFGSVTAGNGATIAPGCSIGALTFTGALTLQSGSTTVMETSADAHANDFINALEEVHYGGTLIVTNVEGAFAAGDSFKLFDAGACHGSFNNIVWPPLSPGLLWTNQLTQNGSIAVVRIIDTTPVGITSTLTGNALHLSWPADHIGWHLEMQTSDLETGLSTGWIAVPGSSATNEFTFPINPETPATFYRLSI